MNDKDKKIVMGSALATADAIAVAIHPGMALAWSLCKSLFGAGMKLREERALQFVEYIMDNPKLFVAGIFETTEFQDGFVLTLENFLRERSEKKRLYIKNIFAGFAESTDKVSFSLERYLNILGQLDEDDIEVLKIFTDDSIIRWHSEFYPDNPEILTKQFKIFPRINEKQASLVLHRIRNDSKFDDEKHVFEILSRLSSLGLIHGQININGQMAHGLFARAEFSKKFIRFIFE